MDSISVEIPASPEYVQVVRLIASGLATRLRFTLDDIEDLKIAVDEMCAYLTGTQGREGTIQISFRLNDKNIEITGSGRFSPGVKVRTELTELSKKILDTVADTASLVQTNGMPTFEVTKSRST